MTTERYCELPSPGFQLGHTKAGLLPPEIKSAPEIRGFPRPRIFSCAPFYDFVAGFQPASFASASVQNQRSPIAVRTGAFS